MSMGHGSPILQKGKKQMTGRNSTASDQISNQSNIHKLRSLTKTDTQGVKLNAPVPLRWGIRTRLHTPTINSTNVNRNTQISSFYFFEVFLRQLEIYVK